MLLRPARTILRMPVIPSSIAILTNFTIFVIMTFQLFLVILLARNWLTFAGCHVKSKFTNRIWPIKIVEGRRAFPAVVKNLHTSVNKNNLVQINITPDQITDCSSKMAPSPLKLCSFGPLNCRSVCNKYLSIKDYVVDEDFDIFAITETWLNPGDCVMTLRLEV